MIKIKKHINFYNIVIIILFLSIVILTKTYFETKYRLDKYEEYTSEKVGNLIRPAAYGIMESEDILREVIKSGEINEHQFQSLYADNIELIKCLHELHYFKFRVLELYCHSGGLRYIDIQGLLNKIKYSAGFCDVHYDRNNIKKKKLSDDELEIFKIVKKVMNDYSNIFNDEQNYFIVTGECHSSWDNSPYYHLDYGKEIEKGLKFIEEICTYNFNSPYRRDIENLRIEN